MRPRERIRELLDSLCSLWESKQDLRFGQLVTLLDSKMTEEYGYEDIFFPEDDLWLNVINNLKSTGYVDGKESTEESEELQLVKRMITFRCKEYTDLVINWHIEDETKNSLIDDGFEVNIVDDYNIGNYTKLSWVTT